MESVQNILLPCTLVLVSPASVLQFGVSIRKKKTPGSVSTLLEFAMLVYKKFFASKGGMAVAENKN